MIESSTETAWMSVAEASRALGITETAVRKRIGTGAIPSRDWHGRKEVLVQVEQQDVTGWQSHPEVAVDLDRALEAARLAGEVMELRARLADVQRDRDRWHQLALESRDQARTAEAQRAALERELRLLIARDQ